MRCYHIKWASGPDTPKPMVYFEMSDSGQQDIETVHIARGQYLFHAGDEGDYAYLVKSGRLQVIQVRKGREIPFAEIGPNELVGEIAIIGGQPRLASVLALESTILIPLSKEAIDHILETDVAMVKHFYRVLIRRLSELYGFITQEDEQGYTVPLESSGPKAEEIPASTSARLSESIVMPDDESCPVESWNAGDTMTVVLPGDVPIEFCYIPAGDFLMGSPRANELMQQDETPQHPVRISKPFWMAKHSVSQAQWNAIMPNNPSEFFGGDYPVEHVSWYDCREFLKRLCRIVGRGFRLPTEAEWEYACRAGTTARFYWGEDANETKIGDYAWYSDNSGINSAPGDPKQPNPVGKKLPNPWGLHDMLGNVWEWCQDRYGEYTSIAVTDPRGPYAGKEQVIRGGGWNNIPLLLRCAKRSKCGPEERQSTIGFRPARTIL